MSRQILQDVINDFEVEKFTNFFRLKNDKFRHPSESLYYEDDNFGEGKKLEEITFDDGNLIVCSFPVKKALSERSGKKAQYELGKKILKESQTDAGIFIFYDKAGNFRFSLIYANYLGKRRDWSTFKRHTFFVSPHQTNKTFLQQVGDGDFFAIEAIKKVFSIEKVTKEFFSEISNWYFWAMDEIELPDDEDKDREIRNAKNLIRLITRIIFIWFMKEKKLVPETLFDKKFLDTTLDYKDKTGSTYYKAILQNLFFATLNTSMKKDDPKSRIFVNEAKRNGFVSDAYMQHGYYRYKRFIKDTELFLQQFENIPFLNGGLFDCLDKRIDKQEIRIDCFSDNPKNETRLKVPDTLFFQEAGIEVDLQKYFEPGSKKRVTRKVRGLISILKSYNFTIDENTPIDEEVALDPELLGKVFENLLAFYNPETAATARKATGSYYTPREVVDYMVDESLVTYLKNHLLEKTKTDASLSRWKENEQELEKQLRLLIDYKEEKHNLNEDETEHLIGAIESAKILDPACGSGAFAMGILHKLVLVLHKLDPDNGRWKKRLIEKVPPEIREETQQSLENKPLDYIRKLGLIETCIYGVDIQEIAIQISKLRFFISLLVEQQPDDSKPNRDIKALPNLETKFVAANTLIVLDKPRQLSIKDPEIENLERQLFETRKNIFYANSRWKKLELQKKEKLLREKLRQKLKKGGFGSTVAEQITSWDPFDQNTHADWFEPEWMFGVGEGFDIVIANPPYVNVEKIDSSVKKSIHHFKTAYQKYDLYVLFYEKSISLLKKSGVLIFISSNKFLSQGYGFLLRKYLLNFEINTIINFNFNVFESSIVRTCIFQLSKKEPQNNKIKIIDVNNINDKYKFLEEKYSYIDQKVFEKTEENNFRINLTKDKIKLLDKVKKGCLCVENICSVNYGLRPSSEKINRKKEYFIKTSNPKGLYKKYFEGKDMGYWRVKKSYFIDYRPDVMYNPMFIELFESEKLVGLRTLSDIGKLRFIYDDEGLFCNDSVVIITPWHLFKYVDYLTIRRNITEEKINTSKKYSIKYLQAILNSKLIKFYVNELLYDGTHFYPDHMKSLPIKILREKEQKPFIDLVEKILAITKDDDYLENLTKQAKVHEYEKQIDQLVYKLYGLTPAEIKIIENLK